MKYLKRYSLLERINHDELKELCDLTLVSLYDDGFYISFPYSAHGNTSLIKLEKPHSTDPVLCNFIWNDVKDYYIPFLKLLNNRYDLVCFRGNDDSDMNIRIECFKNIITEWSFYSYNDLVNEFIEPREDSKIYSISVIIKEKI